MKSASPFQVHSASLSDRGRGRDENQDACVTLRGAAGEHLLVVADGMGGHRGGSVASRMLIDVIRDTFERAPQWDVEVLRNAILDANTQIYQKGHENPELLGMGTTVVAVLLVGCEHTGWVAHVGDSRAYRFRSGALEPMTVDHSVVEELLQRGAIASDEAATHPRRNEILRSVGIEPTVEVELAQFDLAQGDAFVLCSDGLSGMMTDQEIAAALRGSRPIEAVGVLVDTANARGGPDNITVIVSALAHDAAAPIRRIPELQRQTVIAAAGVTAILLIVIIALFLSSNEPSVETAVPRPSVTAAPPAEDTTTGAAE